MPMLVSIVEYALQERYVFAEFPVTIGRLSKNQVPIKHKQVSRAHAQVVQDPAGHCVLEDLNSTNFVYVNRKQTQREALNHGDLVNVGGVADFLFLEREDEALANEILGKLRDDPEYSPANFALKKTMASLVDELSANQSVVMGAEGPVQADITGSLNDIESLYEIAYTINSSLDLGEVLGIIIQKVLGVTGAERGFVMLKPGDRQLGMAGTGEAPPLEVMIARSQEGDLEGADRESFSQSIVHKALESGDTYVSTNAAEDPIMQTQSVINYAIREAMCAPLRVRDDIIGTIYVDTRQVRGSFQKRDILFFEAICHQAAIALSNASMTEDLRAKQVQLEKAYADLLDRSKRLGMAKKIVEQKVKELSALNAVASGINVASDLDSILRLVLEKAVDVLSAERGRLMLFNEEEEHLYTQVEVGGVGKPDTKVQLPYGEANIWTKALRDEQPVMAVRDDPDRREWLPDDPQVSILMTIPMVYNKRKIGVLGIYNPRHQRAFTAEEVTLASSLANQASITIENVRLYNLAIYDGLTKVHLRRYFDIWLKKEFDRTRRYNGKLSLVLLDVDHFKHVNDEYGHQCGDEVLRILGRLIKDSIRSVDLGARYGGEEFAVILPETDLEGAVLFADRLRARIEETPIRWDARLFPITLSAGVATFPGAAEILSPSDLIECADKALYFSKENGRNQVTGYDPNGMGRAPEPGPATKPPGADTAAIRPVTPGPRVLGEGDGAA